MLVGTFLTMQAKTMIIRLTNLIDREEYAILTSKIKDGVFLPKIHDRIKFNQGGAKFFKVTLDGTRFGI